MRRDDEDTPPTDAVGRCDCCHLYAAPPPTPGEHRGTRHYCPDCRKHLGNDVDSALRRDRQHVAAWEGAWEHTAGQAAQAHADEVERLRSAHAAEVEQLRTQLESRPVRLVDGDAQARADAEAERDKAYRSRDHAYATLAEVWVEHRGSSPDGHCRCGLRKCRTRDLLTDHAGLRQWTERQVQRLNDGLTCSLPERHPARLDPRWTVDA